MLSDERIREIREEWEFAYLAAKKHGMSNSAAHSLAYNAIRDIPDLLAEIKRLRLAIELGGK